MLKASLPFVLCLFALAPTACASSAEDEDLDSSDNNLTNSSGRGPCTSNSATSGRCLSEAEVAKIVRDAGFPENLVSVMVCTAMMESGYYERASHKNNNDSVDRGVFQINSIHIGGTRGCPSTSAGLFDAATNAKCALAVYQGQQRNNSDPTYGVSRAWYGYRSFKSDCDKFRLSGSAASPVQRTGTGVGGTGSVEDLAGGPGPAPDIQDPTPTTTTPTKPSGGSSTPGSCWAGTLGMFLPPGGCYARQSDGMWFQCNSGQWYRGVDADGFAGPFGTCEPSYPLNR